MLLIFVAPESGQQRSGVRQDPGVFNEGILLHKALPRFLLANTKPAGFPFVTWNSLISHRAERFLAGDWQAMPSLVLLSERR